MTARPVIVMLAFLIGLAALSHADDQSKKFKNSRQDLEKINKQLKDTQRKVDSLKRLESNLQSTISGYHERVSRNKKQVAQLEEQLGSVRQKLADNVEVMDATEERLAKIRTGYVAFLVDYYRHRRYREVVTMASYENVLSGQRLTRYLERVSGQSTQAMVSANDSLQRLTRSVDSLEQAGSVLDRQRQEKRAKINLDLSLKRRDESSLGSVRRQAGVLQERLASLSETARQMENIIAKLEKTQQERARQQGAKARIRSGAFDKLQGSLRPPIKGRISSTFGWKADPNTNLKSFSPGIDIIPAKGQIQVSASAAGRVAYVGNLRGYDNFVILAHDDDYYTTYAGLAQVTVEMNELVEAGQKLGVKGDGPVHFEIRREREHLDPATWLNTDEF
jgi:septal ring factor EnvC (AmiA/AmiB activator)